MNRLSTIYVLSAAVLWGVIGVFVNKLYALGLLPSQIVLLRASFAAVLLLVYYMLTNKSYLKIKLGDMKYFIGTGLLSFAFFNWCLFIAIKLTSLSVATILLYTAPAFVSLLSWILFKEKLGVHKLLSLLLTFIGCVLVSGYFQSAEHRISFLGILAGVGSGLGYALYSIFGKYALRKYDAMTIPLYTFGAAAIGFIPFTDFTGILDRLQHIEVLLLLLGLALFSTVLPFILYTKGLSRLESGKASLIATLEPVVASSIGFTVFHEAVTVHKVLGIVLVITAIILIREKADATETPEKN